MEIPVLLGQAVQVDLVAVVLLLAVQVVPVPPDKVTTVEITQVEPAYTLLVVEEEPELLGRVVPAAAVQVLVVLGCRHQ
jgi:hypothetical protein